MNFLHLLNKTHVSQISNEILSCGSVKKIKKKSNSFVTIKSITQTFTNE